MDLSIFSPYQNNFIFLLSFSQSSFASQKRPQVLTMDRTFRASSLTATLGLRDYQRVSAL